MKSLLLTTFLLLSSCINPQDAKNKGEIVRAMADAISKKYADAPQLTIEDFKNHQGKAVLVDVRSEEEIKVSKIRGAITREFFEKRINEDPNAFKGQSIVAYCTIGERSSQYAIELKKKGFKAFNLKESILGWTQRKLPLIDPQGKETKTVHVYGEAWNLVPDDHKGVWE